MNKLVFALAWTIPIALSVAAASEPACHAAWSGPPLILIERGQPRAEIVVAGQRPRMVTLAGLELQHFLAKISGARLPIVTTPTAAHPLKVYIGQSPYTDQLGITAEGLRDGAYRIASGPDWLVLIGKDFDFDFSKLPWPLSRKDVPRACAQWDQAIAGPSEAAWAFPFASGQRTGRGQDRRRAGSREHNSGEGSRHSSRCQCTRHA